MHVGGFAPFSFEITDKVKAGTNSLVVKVDNKREKSNVPTLNADWWNYGGLTRAVTLVRTSAKFIAEHRLWLESDDQDTIVATVKLAEPKEGEPVKLSIPELGVELTEKTNESGIASFRVEPKDLERWSPEHPKLYQVTLSSGEDKICEPLGFRTIRTHGKQLLLNGKPVFLRGISIHEEFPLSGGGRVNSPDKAKQLLLWAKELNCNFVRLAHYPHNEEMTRLCDELGLLAWSEIPVYWTIDWNNSDTYQNAEQQLTEMIRRDANRASIIIWSMANETPLGETRTSFISRLAAKARELDSTRLISAAMERRSKPDSPNVNVVEDPLADVVDIVAFNEYIGWYEGLPEKCARVSWEIPYDKPVLVSEFGGDAQQGLFSAGRKNSRKISTGRRCRCSTELTDSLDVRHGY